MKKGLIILIIAAGMSHGFRGFERDTLELWNTWQKVTEYPDSVKFINDEENDLALVSIDETVVQYPFPLEFGFIFEEQYASLYSYKDSIWDTTFYNSPLDSTPTVKDSFKINSVIFAAPLLNDFSYHQFEEDQIIRKFVFMFFIKDEKPDSSFFIDTLFVKSDHYYVIEKISKIIPLEHSEIGYNQRSVYFDLMGRKPMGQSALPKHFRTVPLRLPE